MRLKAGSYELDAEGRPIIPPTLKLWADRLDVRQAESFCRHKLGLPRLPARRRYSGPTFAETARAIFRRFRADERLRKQQLRRTAALEDDLWPSEFDERPAPNEENRTGYRWTFEDERRFKADAEREALPDESTEEPGDRPAEGRTIEELEYERIMAIPPPAPLWPAIDNAPSPHADRQEACRATGAGATSRPMTNAEIISAVAIGKLSIEEAAALLNPLAAQGERTA